MARTGHAAARILAGRLAVCGIRDGAGVLPGPSRAAYASGSRCWAATASQSSTGRPSYAGRRAAVPTDGVSPASRIGAHSTVAMTARPPAQAKHMRPATHTSLANRCCCATSRPRERPARRRAADCSTLALQELGICAPRGVARVCRRPCVRRPNVLVDASAAAMAWARVPLVAGRSTTCAAQAQLRGNGALRLSDSRPARSVPTSTRLSGRAVSRARRARMRTRTRSHNWPKRIPPQTPARRHHLPAP